jgi:glycosyltransferase involved in cell wall biosynthesis
MNSAVMPDGVDRKARRKLAIVSTYDDLCGIAGYTRALARRLSRDFDVRVFDLDQFLMRSTHRSVRELADREIAEMGRAFAGFDCVNIQLEYGTLGRQPNDMTRRFKMLASAAPQLSVTFHTTLTRDDTNRWRDIFWAFVSGRWRRALDMLHARQFERSVGDVVIRHLRRLQAKKWVAIIVHTRRDARLMKHVNRLRNVFDHPLAFLSPAEVERTRLRAHRAAFPALAALPAGAKVIGVFGFLGEYKGVETAIRALRHVPDDYHLAIFGGVHPNEIRRDAVNGYVAKLLEEIHADASVFDDAPEGRLNLTLAAGDLAKLFEHPKNLAPRVHFMGAQSDDKFADAMAVCDIVALCYHEVGQSSSGPMSIAIEMGSRVIATRNHAFLQFARYHPERVEFFDIGNHLELAERLRGAPASNAYPAAAFDAESNAAVYRAANSASAAPGPERLPAEAARALAGAGEGAETGQP